MQGNGSALRWGARSGMQIDTPMNLYEQPKNTFVAALISSPSMNLLAGAIVAVAGVATTEFRAADNAFSLTLSGERAVIMGVRPEDIYFQRSGKQLRDVRAVSVHIKSDKSLARLLKTQAVLRFGYSIDRDSARALWTQAKCLLIA